MVCIPGVKGEAGQPGLPGLDGLTVALSSSSYSRTVFVLLSRSAWP